ncbi:MAG: hypothetical protein QM496_02710 [Verrucomicrobiota bacterium]
MKQAHATIWLSFVLVFALAMVFVPSEAKDDNLRQKMVRMEDHGGEIVFRGTGKKTSANFSLKLRFSGFYVWRNPVLSSILQAKMKEKPSPSDLIADHWYIYPINTTLSYNGRLKRVKESSNPKSTSTSVTWHDLSYNQHLPLPEQDQWPENTRTSVGPNQPSYSPVSIHVIDHRAIGGGLKLEIQLLSTAFQNGLAQWQGHQAPKTEKGGRTTAQYFRDCSLTETTTGLASLAWAFHLNTSKLPADMSRISVGGSPSGKPARSYSSFDFIVNEEVKLPEDFGLENLSFSDYFEKILPTGSDKNAHCSTPETEMLVSCKFQIGAKQEIAATIEPYDKNEATWMPKPELDQRLYRIKLNKPGHESVEAIRVKLVETSQHPGIATNAGNHILAMNEQCRDCKSFAIEPITVLTRFPSSQHEDSVPISRGYDHYSKCPLDSLPDLYFREDAGNKADAWKLDEDKVTGELKYDIGQTLLLEKVEKDEYHVQLMVKDGAASGKLKAEVKIAGNWFPITAIGKTANENKEHLQIPLDKDNNGIADAWSHNGHDPAADNDAIPLPEREGDGLCNFEEYRGIYSKGLFERLDPNLIDIFVHDYSGRMSNALDAVKKQFAEMGIQLWVLYRDEMYHEMVNWQKTEHRQGLQFTIVMMETNANSLKIMLGDSVDWARIAGKASSIGPPRDQDNTVIIDNFDENGAQNTIAHEIGHKLSIRHHGDTDFGILDPLIGSKVYIATPHGQHSGNSQCVMQYRAATKFASSKLQVVPGIFNSSLLQDLPDNNGISGFRFEFCRSREGTGINTANTWSGDALYGRCLHRLNVKSY